MNDAPSPLERQKALQDRTMKFALVSIRICRSMQRTMEGRHIAGQLVRSSTSIASNYRAACRARSRREFVAKLGIVVEEGDESLFWLDLAHELELDIREPFVALRKEANELVAIFTAARTTAARGLPNRPNHQITK